MNTCIPLLFVVLGVIAPGAERASADAKACEIVLDGDGVTELMLQDERGGYKVDLTGPIYMPPGRYRVMKIVLQGGNTYFDTVTIRDQDWFTLAPGQPYHLKVGGPLVPTVQVTRQGDSLLLSYSVVDEAGRQFTFRDRSHRPYFTVYQNGKRVGSGDFEFG